jgi:hypothetical protein
MCSVFRHCRDPVHRSRRVLLVHYSPVVSLSGEQQLAQPVVRSPAAVRDSRLDLPGLPLQTPAVSLRRAVVYSKVAVGDCSRVLLALHRLVESALPVLESQASTVVRSPVAVRGFRRDLPVHYSLVASPPLPALALAPPVSRPVVVVRDCRRVHPLHYSPDGRRVRSSRLAPAYPEVLV